MTLNGNNPDVHENSRHMSYAEYIEVKVTMQAIGIFFMVSVGTRNSVEPR